MTPTLIEGDFGIDFSRGVDFVISNPPYGIKCKGANNALFDLAHKNPETRKGVHNKVNSENLFTELAIKCLNDNGEVLLILPNSLFNNSSEQPYRDYIGNRLRIWLSMSLPIHTFIASDTNVNTGVLILGKPKPVDDYQILFVMYEHIGFDNRMKPCKDNGSEIAEEYIRFRTENP